MDLRGNDALVTGASHGTGAATARAVAERGVRLPAGPAGAIDTAVVPAELRGASRPDALPPPSSVVAGVVHALDHARPGDVSIARTKRQDPWRHEFAPTLPRRSS
jgi:NAD(P)-dependent dehydrogenase (short-subunit alcohol dehydrogenase family)